jgi:hypothetical protein
MLNLPTRLFHEINCNPSPASVIQLAWIFKSHNLVKIRISDSLRLGTFGSQYAFSSLAILPPFDETPRPKA